ncbi:hypothetical protein ACLFMI_10940 [Pseudonocardia nantongensis]|uniref:hypothetical protein n=1 Tax=Pseudonocardia nantongensis TaxID=1181885 RepID=UPI00397AEFD5
MTFDIETEVLAFAQELQDLLDGVLPRPDSVPAEERRIRAEAMVDQARYRLQVAAPGGLITLTKDGDPVASLRVSIQCTRDTDRTYLAVHRSDFELRGWADKTPIARLDFLRDAHTVPACHWNIHAERGAASRLLTLGNPSHSGAFSELHFPVGGARMRPCLEDVLAFVLHEFGVDRCAGSDPLLHAGRERWRRRQIATLVRDAPGEAVRVLRDLGYGVTDPVTGPAATKTGKLNAW